ncbi:helix-turn-helix transcriptional regulator [Agrobacterium sp. CCNWLW32]|uniref:LexA family transcriptional regulator n=1 Tax=Agrobacterium sp. CCNWLW32 TaxID=3122072 RepID=UPI00300F81AB
MMEKTDRLKAAREQAGYKYASDAAKALSVNASTYRAHENGQNDFDLAEATVYAKKFNVDPLWIMTGKTADTLLTETQPLQAEVYSPNAKIGDRVVGLGRKIKVYGRAVGGVDGEFDMNGSVLYETMAPPVLSDVRGAYGVQVSGDSMSPRYEDGEVCFVDPVRRVKKGDYVIAQIRTEEHGPILAYVKKFIRHNAQELVLEQFNPPKLLTFPANQVHSVHYIALAGNA